MDNHVHLALQTGKISLSKIIQNNCFRYARWINKSQKRIGHLFQGRYKAILVNKDNYLLSLIKYIHLNPVKAKLVENAEDYEWSSHRVYLGCEILEWLTTEFVLGCFGNDCNRAILNYQQYMLESYDVETPINEFFKGDKKEHLRFKEERFMEQFEQTEKSNTGSLLDLDHILYTVCDYYCINLDNLQMRSRKHEYAKIRAIIAWIAQEYNVCTLTNVARLFNRDVTGLIRTMRRFEINKMIVNELSEIKIKLNKL